MTTATSPSRRDPGGGLAHAKRSLTSAGGGGGGEKGASGGFAAVAWQMSAHAVGESVLELAPVQTVVFFYLNSPRVCPEPVLVK